MLDKNTSELFKLLNSQFSSKLHETEGIANSAGILKVLHETKQYMSDIFTGKTLTADDREELLIYLQWIFNKTVFIALHSNEAR